MKTCKYEDCDRRVILRGMCSNHYLEEWRTAPLVEEKPKKAAKEPKPKKQPGEKPAPRRTSVDATRSREHIKKMRAAGYGYKRISEATGVAKSSLMAIEKQSERVSIESERKILAVEIDAERIPDGTPVSSVGPVRRIQALIAAGWSQQTIADRVGTTSSMLTGIMQRRTMFTRTAMAIDAAYAELSAMTPPEETARQRATAAQARKRAQENGWVPVDQWADIDDYRERPS